jgi:hypothetical protein
LLPAPRTDVPRHVEAQDLAEQRLRVLPVREGVLLAAAVAGRDVQVAVLAEQQLTAVVVGGDLLRDRDHGALLPGTTHPPRPAARPRGSNGAGRCS